MFARLATILAVSRRRALPPKALPGRRIDRVRPRARPNLLCRWHLDRASGRPVCIWEVDDPVPRSAIAALWPWWPIAHDTTLGARRAVVS